MELKQKKIILIAHDGKVEDLLRWSKFNRDLLAQCNLYASSPVATLLAQQLQLKAFDLKGGLLYSNQDPALSANNGHGRAFDLVVFFWDASEPITVQSEVETVLHLARMGNVPIAGNETAAYAMFPWCVLANA